MSKSMKPLWRGIVESQRRIKNCAPVENAFSSLQTPPANMQKQRMAQTILSVSFLLLAAMASLWPHPSPGAPWPRLGGLDGSFVSPETGLARSWPTNGPRVLWTIKLGKGFAGAAVRDGEVYVLDRPDNRQDVLRCVDLTNGRELSRLAYDAPGALPYDGSRNVPTVDDHFVFAVGPFGHFLCVDRRTHQPVWTRHLVQDFKDPLIDREGPPADRADKLARAQVPMWGVSQAPLLYRDTVIVAPQTQKTGLVAYEKVTGRIRWQSGYVGRNWYSHVSPTLMRLCGVEQILMLAQPGDPERSPSQAPPGLVSSVDPATGRILWTTQTPKPHKIPVPQPLQVDEDRIFVTGGYGLGCCMVQIGCTNGAWTTRWLFQNKTVAGHIHSPAFYQEKIFALSLKEQGASQSGLVCLDRDGQALWQSGPGLQFHDGAMLLVDGMALVMNGRTGQLHLLELSATGCKPLASAKVLEGSQIWAPLALSDGRLLARDQQQMKCLDLRKP
jgi:outer membrane protein assembly factor BamB